MDRRQELLEKFRQKTITRDELNELLADLRTSDFSQYEPWMDQVWQSLSNSEEVDDGASRRVYAQLQRAIPLKSRTQTVRLWLRVAAVLVLSAGAIFYFFLQPESTQRFATSADETRTLVLPDSSVVVLNEHSTLSYANQWNTQSVREVWLTGEAYFSVKHTASNQKFIVHTNPIAIEVLGTKFNVHNRDHQPEVTLTSGSVQLTSQHSDSVQRIMMRPGEQVKLTKTQVFEKNTVNPEIYTAWKQQELVLDNTPLSEVARLLERQHDIRVNISDSTLRSITLSGTYPNGNMNMVLDMLADILTADARIERSTGQITIRKKQ